MGTDGRPADYPVFFTLLTTLIGHQRWYTRTMQTKRRPKPPATHQQCSLYPERRMSTKPETGNRRPETGSEAQETRKPGTQKSVLTRKRSLRGKRPFAGTLDPGSVYPVSGLRPPVFVSGFLSPFAGLPIRAIRGRLGDRVYKTYGDKIIVTRVPSFEGYVPSAAQRDRRRQMRAATAFAQAVYADPAAKAIYVTAARALGRQPFRLAISDFLRGRPRVAVETGRRVVPPKVTTLSVLRKGAEVTQTREEAQRRSCRRVRRSLGEGGGDEAVETDSPFLPPPPRQARGLELVETAYVGGYGRLHRSCLTLMRTVLVGHRLPLRPPRAPVKRLGFGVRHWARGKGLTTDCTECTDGRELASSVPIRAIGGSITGQSRLARS
jgi:hypothetical protein